jgi:hypothetical protein
MSDDQPKISNPDADTEMDIAINTQMTSDNLRTMGYEGAADTLHDAAHEAATKAVQDGYVDRPPEEVPLLPGQERIGHGDPQPATTMGVPSGPGPGGAPGPPEWPDYHEPVDPYHPEGGGGDDPVIDIDPVAD